MQAIKILVADDELLVRNLLRRLLLSWGHEVIEASNGEETLAIMESAQDVQLVILDWNMPGIDGAEVCRQLRAKKCLAYIMMLTGRSSDTDIVLGLEAGANDYITKPFSNEGFRVRMLIAARYVEMHASLSARVAELEGGALDRRDVDNLLKGMMAESGVSDLLFVTGKPPQVEIYGKLTPARVPGWDEVLTPAKIQRICDFLMDGNERLISDYATYGSCDCSYAIHDFARMRVNIYKQNGAPAIVMRKLQSEIPSIDRLKLPPIFNEIIKEKNGIIFVTGGTGSGKTTTLAAMLNEMNQSSEIHIVTLEDPIEFLHPQKKATFSQRQLGQDFDQFSTGLRAALRQAPKVILVGEIRDRETMEIAMTASETGHLVFSTLHTINAGQTINRILGMFSKEEEAQVRQRLAETVRYVISQRLISKVGGGRLMVTEIMGSSLRTREVICFGESEGRTFQEIIEAGVTKGWHSFDQSLLKAFEGSLITEETAMLYCNNKGAMSQRIDRVKQLRGGDDATQQAINLKLVASPVPAKAPPATPSPQPRPAAPIPNNLNLAK